MQDEQKKDETRIETEGLVKELEGFPMTELEEKDLDGVAGGEVPENGNCYGCYCDPE